jgi:DNA-binding NarL/FixJ family response regulator
MPVRVFHVDDSEAYRLLLAETLDPAGTVTIVGGAGEPEAAVEGVARCRPDVVLLDQLGGVELVARLREVAPGVRIVMLSGYLRDHADPEVVAASDGFVVKSPELDELRRAVLGAVGAG